MDCNSNAVQAYHNNIGIDKCSRPPISPGPGEIPPPPPLSVGLVTCSFLLHPWAPDKGAKGGLELSIVGGGQASFTILPISVGWMGGEWPKTHYQIIVVFKVSGNGIEFHVILCIIYMYLLRYLLHVHIYNCTAKIWLLQ